MAHSSTTTLRGVLMMWSGSAASPTPPKAYGWHNNTRAARGGPPPNAGIRQKKKLSIIRSNIMPRFFAPRKETIQDLQRKHTRQTLFCAAITRGVLIGQSDSSKRAHKKSAQSQGGLGWCGPRSRAYRPGLRLRQAARHGWVLTHMPRRRRRRALRRAAMRGGCICNVSVKHGPSGASKR